MIWPVVLSGIAAVVVAAAVAGLVVVRRKSMQYWLPAYCVPAEPAEPPDRSRPLHVFLAVCDHWEPEWNGVRGDAALHKVERWVAEYPQRFSEFLDSDGRPPQHTFFFPQDEYKPVYLDRIGDLCRAGFGDVDVHLHHKDDTPAALEDKLARFRDTLFHRHGLLRRDPRTGDIVYGFIHGNWTLCNSHPDGVWCGVDNELEVLMKTGCYADFTLPSAPSPTQTRTINSIYYARDIPGRRKSHDRGVLARVGQPPPPGHLLMIQGPLVLDWRQRRYGMMPRIENGDVTAGRAMSALRLEQWLGAQVHVRGQPNWLFVKLHTHGCKDGNIDAWLGHEMQQFHRDLRQLAEQRPELRYHYVTAWEMAQLVHQAEAGSVIPAIGRCARATAA